jgi:hypothetical protein
MSGQAGPVGAALIALLGIAGAAMAQSGPPAVPQTCPAPAADPIAERVAVAPEASATPPAEVKPVAPSKPAAVDAKPSEPAKRPRANVAILQALDKVTTETLRFEVPVGQPIRYKTLIFTVRACETAASDEIAPETAAYVVVDTQPKAVSGRIAPAGRQIYKGWMYANAPGVHPLEHPVYDAWLIACKTASPVVPVAKR